MDRMEIHNHEHHYHHYRIRLNNQGRLKASLKSVLLTIIQFIEFITFDNTYRICVVLLLDVLNYSYGGAQTPLGFSWTSRMDKMENHHYYHIIIISGSTTEVGPLLRFYSVFFLFLATIHRQVTFGLLISSIIHPTVITFGILFLSLLTSTVGNELRL